MNKRITFFTIIVLILLIMVGCKTSYIWTDEDPDLGFVSYSVVETENTETIYEDTDDDGEDEEIINTTGYTYDLSGEIENSGFKGKFVIGISAQPLGSTNWLDFGDYGPVIIDIGTKSYTTSINAEPDSRLQKFKFKLYIITDDGDKKFDEEVIYDVIVTPY